MASTTTNEYSRTFEFTAAAVGAYSLVAVDSDGKCSAAGDNNTDELVGVTIADVASAGFGTVRFLNAGGTVEVLCGGNTIAVGDKVYTDGSGKIGTDSSNHHIGVALEASSTDGDVIEVCVKL